MASTNTLSVVLSLIFQEILDATEYPGGTEGSDRSLRADDFATRVSLSSTSTPSLDLPAVIHDITIGASATVIDLTAADIGIGRTQDFTGDKLIAYQFKAPIANAGDVTVDADASNGYNLFGASGLHVFQPGETLAGVVNGASSTKPTVGASLKGVRIDGTQNDTFEIALAFGT